MGPRSTRMNPCRKQSLPFQHSVKVSYRLHDPFNFLSQKAHGSVNNFTCELHKSNHTTQIPKAAGIKTKKYTLQEKWCLHLKFIIHFFLTSKDKFLAFLASHIARNGEPKCTFNYIHRLKLRQYSVHCESTIGWMLACTNSILMIGSTWTSTVTLHWI